jgi:hypothetical protein
VGRLGTGYEGGVRNRQNTTTTKKKKHRSVRMTLGDVT